MVSTGLGTRVRTYFILVTVPVGPGGRHLPAEFAGAGPILVDEVVQRHVGQGHLLGVRDDEGSLHVYING